MGIDVDAVFVGVTREGLHRAHGREVFHPRLTIRPTFAPWRCTIRLSIVVPE